MSNVPNLGYFLRFKHWENALNLLKYQLEIKQKNKHFNTLSMFYYEKVMPTSGHLEKSKYFDVRVANNIFYGLRKEFAVIPYTIPKSDLGIRKYKFFTLPMRVLYYAVGLYLVELSQDFIDEYYRKFANHIFSRYGGNLRFQKDALMISYNSIWYKPHYQQFKRKVIHEINNHPENKLIIHLDIQNFYDEIDVQTLLHLLSDYIKPSVARQLNFDSVTQGQIISFFAFIEDNKIGIPQSDNDILSSFIGWLYLVFGDLLIEQEILLIAETLENYQIIRYMDDYYISLTFHPNLSSFQKERVVNIFTAHVADMLYSTLGLRLNTKTKFYRLSNDSDKDDLLRNLKRVSPGYEIPDDESGEPPAEKIDRMLERLQKLKDSQLDPSFSFRRKLDTEILKDVYIKSVANLLKKPEYIRRIDRIFSDFNFDLVIAQPREIIIMLLYSHSAKRTFQEYLLSKTRLSSRDAYLILTFLSQTNFNSIDLIRKLKTFGQLSEIMNIFEEGDVYSDFPGYFDLRNEQVQYIYEKQMHNVIEQIRLRAFAEQRQQYSVALNHLLNEIHSIAWALDAQSTNAPRYDANQVLAFLNRKAVPHEVRMKIRNLFDRRNKNPVSHADTASWPVSKSEYIEYKKQVGRCLAYLL